MGSPKRILKYFYEQFILFLSFLIFLVRSKNSERAFEAMISVFCVDRGKTISFYSRLLSQFFPPLNLPRSSGLFGSLDKYKLASIHSDLEEKGYAIADVLIPEELCDKLEEITKGTISFPFKNKPSDPIPPPRIYDPDQLMSSRYSFLCQDLIQNETIQDLMADESLLAIANSYFQGQPVLDSVIMSISTDYSQTPSEDAAQMFHFDMDRLKWLKFFIYLSDVDDENGPHVFVEGSHRPYGIPSPLLKKGYARIEDHEVAAYFPSHKIKEFKCRRGTIFVEDTRGLHKGKVLSKGRRLLLQVQYNQSLFGASVLKPHVIKQLRSQKLEILSNKYPGVFKNFVFPTSKS